MEKIDIDNSRDIRAINDGATLGDNMEVLDIGLELKAAREHKDISLEKVYEDTRIGINFLRSLEQGRVEHLPHPVYARGFVRNYADYLGLDGEKIAQNFSRVFRAEDQFEKINPKDLPTSLRTTKQGLRPPNYSTIIIALALFVLIGLGWFLYSSFSIRSTQKDHDAAVHDPALETPTPDPVLPYVPGLHEGLPAVHEELVLEDHSAEADSAFETEAGPEAEPLVDTGLDDAALEQERPDSPVTDAADETDVLLTAEQDPAEEASVIDPEARTEVEKHILVIRASADCWLRVNYDQSSREAYLRPGESIRVEFEKLAQVILGNAGGVEIYLNDEPYPFEAASGEVKTLEISPSDSASS